MCTGFFFFSRFFFSAPQIPEPESLVFIFFGVPAKGFAPVGLVSRRVGRAPLLKTVGMGAPPVQCTGRTFTTDGLQAHQQFYTTDGLQSHRR